MSRFEIGVKDFVSGNVYYTGYTVSAKNQEEAIDEYLSFNMGQDRKAVYANRV